MAQTAEITYRFEFANGTSWIEVPLVFDLPSHALRPPVIRSSRGADAGGTTAAHPVPQSASMGRASVPSTAGGPTGDRTAFAHWAWMELASDKCNNCPLNPAQVQRCWVAVNLAPIVQHFGDMNSTEPVTVTVRTPQRDYVKRCTLYEGMSSMVGLIMVTSGCPVMDRLRPMAHTHLPFANSYETTYRAIGSYLIGEAIRFSHGEKPDWELQGLRELYDNVRQVNEGMSRRLKSIGGRDAAINAVIRLDALADTLSLILSGDWSKELEPMYAHVSQPASPADAGDP